MANMWEISCPTELYLWSQPSLLDYLTTYLPKSFGCDHGQTNAQIKTKK